MNRSTVTQTDRNKNSTDRKVPPLIINKKRITTENDDLSSPSPNSDAEFRSPIKTAKNKFKTASITETHLKDSETFKIPDYYIYIETIGNIHTSQEE